MKRNPRGGRRGLRSATAVGASDVARVQEHLEGVLLGDSPVGAVPEGAVDVELKVRLVVSRGAVCPLLVAVAAEFEGSSEKDHEQER